VNRRVAVGLGLAAALLYTTTGVAQQVIRAAGTVKDDDGSPIRGAVITAVNPDRAPPRLTATSNDKGQFGIIGIRRGSWTFTVEAPGYEPVRFRHQIVAGTRQAPIEVRLAKSAVRSAQPLDDVKGADIQQRIDRAEALAAKGDVDAAIAEWRGILARLPALTSAYLRIAELLEAKPDVEGARAVYRALLDIEPDNAKARAAIDRLTRKF
jgi:Carboxypeptidase regulatory-like domain